MVLLTRVSEQRLINVYRTHLVLNSRQEVRGKCHQGEMSFMLKVTDPSRKQAFVNVGISIFRNSNLGERIGQQDYLHFQKKRIGLKKNQLIETRFYKTRVSISFPFFSCSNICIVILKKDLPTLTLFGFGRFILSRQTNLGPRSH